MVFNNFQALLLNRNYYTKRQAHDFIKRNNIIPIKPIHATEKYYRIRLETPNYKKYIYRIMHIHINDGLIFKVIK